MFINCRHCHALVATDPATDLPPEHCPRCRGVLRRADAAPAPLEPPPGPAAAPGQAAPASIPADAGTGGIPAPPTAADADGEPPTAPGASEAPAVASPPDAPLPGPAADTPGPPPGHPPLRPGPGTRPPPAPARASAPAPAPAPGAEPASAPAAGSGPEPESGAGTTAAAAGGEPPAAAATGHAAGTVAPSTPPGSRPAFGRARTTDAANATPRRRIGVIAVVVSLVLLLALQLVLADRERLAADAGWRPLVVATCGLLGCEVPVWREPAAIVLLSREVRPDPDHGALLRVRARFRNDARWAQAWPRLLLVLSDVDGRAVAARAFEPHEYLGATRGTLLEPGQSVDVAFDVLEPSVATVSYTFDFRP